MVITKKVKETFFNAFIVAAQFSEESMDIDMDMKSARAHCDSFLYRAMPYFITENKAREMNGNFPKELTDLGQDFYFTVMGHGVGFWEVGENDWLYFGDDLDKIAKLYEYSF